MPGEPGWLLCFLISLRTPWAWSFGSSAPSSVRSREEAAPHHGRCIFLTGFAHYLEEGWAFHKQRVSFTGVPETCTGALQSLCAVGWGWCHAPRGAQGLLMHGCAEWQRLGVPSTACTVLVGENPNGFCDGPVWQGGTATVLLLSWILPLPGRNPCHPLRALARFSCVLP